MNKQRLYILMVIMAVSTIIAVVFEVVTVLTKDNAKPNEIKIELEYGSELLTMYRADIDLTVGVGEEIIDGKLTSFVHVFKQNGGPFIGGDCAIRLVTTNEEVVDLYQADCMEWYADNALELDPYQLNYGGDFEAQAVVVQVEYEETRYGFEITSLVRVSPWMRSERTLINSEEYQIDRGVIEFNFYQLEEYRATEVLLVDENGTIVIYAIGDVPFNVQVDNEKVVFTSAAIQIEGKDWLVIDLADFSEHQFDTLEEAEAYQPN